MLAPLAIGLAALAPVATIDRPRGAAATCGHQSMASFKPRSSDLVVGPLVLVGGRRFSSAESVMRFGGMKYPALVRAGHRAVVEVVGAPRGGASLSYSDEAHASARRTAADGDRVVDFRSCSQERASSSYGKRDVTFWSGFILTAAPRCVHLRVWVDGERAPRRASVAVGQRCG